MPIFSLVFCTTLVRNGALWPERVQEGVALRLIDPSNGFPSASLLISKSQDKTAEFVKFTAEAFYKSYS